MRILFLLFFLGSCSSIMQLSSDKKLIEQYPQCYHQYRNVFNKCIELNKKGKKVNAQRVEQLLKDEKL